MARAVLFDLDGTLVNTIGDIRQAVNTALKEKNIAPLNDLEIMSCVGHGLKNSLKGALEYRGANFTETELDVMYHVLMDYYSKFPYLNSTPYPHILEMLKRLKQKELKIGVYSNKEDSLVKIIVSKVFPDLRFEFVHGRGVFVPKPDKDGVDAFLSLTGEKACDMIYAGDSEVDYLTGKNAGTGIVICSWGFRNREQLLSSGIPENLIVSDTAQLEQRIME